MDPTELQAALKAGIAAVRQGDKARGRELLLRVVQADERIEPAWLWLSAAVDDPADQLVALENVLALNPGHAQAQAGARALRQKLGLGVATAPGPAPQPPLPEPRPVPEPVAALAPASPAAPPAPRYPFLGANPEDDPYQCAYCGFAADPEAARCPQCHRGLMVAGPWQNGGTLYVMLILAGLQAQSALVQAMGAFGYVNFPTFAQRLPAPEIWAANPVVPAFVRASAWLLLVLVLLGEARWRFRAVALVTLADLLWTAAGYGLGEVGPVLAAANAMLSGLIFLSAGGAVLGELRAQVRLRVVLDRNLLSALECDRHAARYAREGKWALAALHWRRAITFRPRNPDLYKSLGAANAQLGRHASARQAWESGAGLDPADPDFPRLLAQLPA